MLLCRDLPPAYRSRAIGLVAVVAIVFAAGFALSKILPPAYSDTVVGLIVLVLLIAVLVHDEWWSSRLRRRLEHAAGRLCPRCTYDLTNLDSPGVCPECGRTFEIETVAAMWRRCRELRRWNSPWR